MLRALVTWLADELEHTHPAPPARCAKGWMTQLTVIRPGITDRLHRPLESTNLWEPTIDTVPSLTPQRASPSRVGAALIDPADDVSTLASTAGE